MKLAEGDTVIVEGKADTLMKVKKIEGIEIKPEFKLGDLDLQTEQMRIAEVLVTPQSDLHGRTLKEANFRQYSGLTVLAIFRHGQSLRDQVSDTVLRVGDLLLVQGEQFRGSKLCAASQVSRCSAKSASRSITRGRDCSRSFFSAPRCIIGGLGLVPLSIAFLSAAVLTILLRCISIERAYEFVDWRLLVLIGGMTAFGTAMDKTGAASYLAGLIVNWFEPFGILAILGGFFVLTIVLTQPMSNAAAALVVLPVAISAAQKLGANERTFAIAIMLAASVSFITPFEPSCILVYGPGKYRFIDFVKVGLGLTAVLTIAVLSLQFFWPL